MFLSFLTFERSTFISSTLNTSRIILGIDPGTNFLGYGILEVSGKSLTVAALGVLKLANYTDQYKKLQKIFETVKSLVSEFHIDALAIEAPFYGKNVQSMLKLGRAQGVCMAAALSENVSVSEYSPRKIKQSVTGRGAASKEQVAGMLHHILTFDEHEISLDATDALAVALCHYYNGGNSKPAQSYSSWSAFVKDNPQKIKSK